MIVTGDARVAEAYALVRSNGSVGPGYAIVDAQGYVRYRTFDLSPAAHAAEIAILLGAL